MGEVFKLNHCYNMDCLPAMELFPDNYFDLAVVDPPYFSGPERRGFYGSKVSKIGVHRDYPVSPAWSKPEPEYFKELFRVCRHYIVWGCNYFDYQFSTGRIVWIFLTDTEALAIRWHMGAYSGEQDWGTLSKVYDRCPEALCLHMADMIATHIMEVEE